MPFSTLPIRRKLVVIGIATIAVALLVNNIVFLGSTYAIVRDSVYDDVVAEAEIMADNTSASLAFNDAASANATLAAMRAKASIDLACLYDAQGQLFAAYHQDASDAACAAAAPADGTRIAASGVSIGRPVAAGARRVGTLYLHGTLTELWSRLGAQGLAALAGLALSTFGGFLLMRRLHRAIADPITSLASTAAEVSRRSDYGLRATKTSNDEVGELVEAFNTMLAHVQRRDQELSRANMDLSREVVERQRIENERIELLRREREANRLKDDFLAALSHELRTPLNAILGWTQIMQSTGAHDDRTGRGLASIERNARAQARMIEDLLDVSRIVSGKFHLKMEVVDLVPLADAAVEVIAPTATARGVHIERRLEGGPYHVCADHDRLQQVLWNLLSNAVKFTPKDGRVTVELRRDGDQCVIEVQDTGIGIAPEFLPAVFDRFRQADGSMSREHGGLGLGLAIVHEVVEMHGGSVSASSDGRNLGATFTVRLPEASASAETTVDDRPRPRSALLSGRRVLVVDDDEDTREIAAAALTNAGANVVAAQSAAEALDRLQREKFSVLVCDIGMPQMDGYELLRRVRAAGGNDGSIPAVALTAYASSDDVARAQAAGFQLHVAKPFNVTALVNAVATLGDHLVDSR